MLFISGLGALLREYPAQSFNLAIEMLFISGGRADDVALPAFGLFQSRNRDAFHFRAVYEEDITITRWTMFQSRNRDAFHFRSDKDNLNRLFDKLCFNLAIEMLFISGGNVTSGNVIRICFNLAIEMLFISGV